MIESAKKLESQPIQPRAITKEMRLAVLVRLHDWVPAGYTLCYSCTRYLPKIENAPWRGDVKIRGRDLRRGRLSISVHAAAAVPAGKSLSR